MKGRVAIVTWLTIFWICCSSTWAQIVRKGNDEFVFLLPTRNGGLTVPGLTEDLPPLSSFDQFRHDSYGNPVPPYTAIETGSKVQTPQGLMFEIPSYASGITDIRRPTNELLPPLASGQVPQNALHTPAVVQPSIELLPPLPVDSVPDGKKDLVTNEITEKPEDVTTVKSETEDEKHNEGKVEEEKPADHKYEGVKYTGGFGGPPGILGEQKEKGYAIKEREEREKKEHEEEKGKTTQNPNEDHTEIPQAVTLAPKGNSSTSTLPSLGFNSVFSSVLPPVKLSAEIPTTEELPSKQSHETEQGLQLSTETSFSATSEEISTSDIPTTEQSFIQPFLSSQQSGLSDKSPTPSKPSLSFNSPQSQQQFSAIPQQPGLSLNSQTTQNPNLPVNSPLPTQPIPSYDSEPAKQTVSPFDSLKPQQPVLPTGSSTPQQTIPSFGPQPTQQPILAQNLNQPQPPISQFGTPVTQKPTSNFNFSPISQEFSSFNSPIPTPSSFNSPIPTPSAFNSPIPTPSSFPTRFDNSEKAQQTPLIPPPLLILEPPHPTTNTFGTAPIPIPTFQPQPQPGILPLSKTDAPGKYRGGFGGPRGILGNQAKPGYAVQPDGSIRDPDHAYKPPKPIAAMDVTSTTTTTTTKAPIIVTPVAKYDKYTGGFGGPPGFLSPYDNKH